jgi:hypothetical protein
MAPEIHMALVLLDLDYRSKYVIHPTKRGMPYNFYFIKFSPSLTVEAAEAGQTLFRAPLTPGVGVWGCHPARNLSHIEEYLHAQFHQDRCSGLDFYSGYTCTHTLTFIY